MRKIVLSCLATLLLTAGVAGDTPIAGDCGSAEDALEAYLAKHHGADPMYVLAFDHRRAPAWWRSYEWTQRRLVPLEPPAYELKDDDVPRLALPRGERLGVFVIDTNPLAYSLDPQVPVVAAREDLAEMQHLVALLGGSVVTTLQLVAQRETGAGGGTEAVELSLDQHRTQQVPVSQAVNDPWKDSRPSLEAIQTVITKQLNNPLAARLGALAASSRSLASDLSAATRAGAEVDQRIREVETGMLTASPKNWPVVEPVDASFAAVNEACEVVEASSPACVGPLSELHELLRMRLLPISTDNRQALVEAETYEKLGEGLRDLTSGCDGLLESLKNVGGALLSSKPNASGPSAEDRAALEPVQEVVSTYLGTVQKRKTMLEAAEKVLQKRGPIGKQVAQYAILAQRRKPFEDMDANCLVHGVLEVPRASGREHDLPWTKVRTDTIKVVFDERLKDVVPAARPATVEAKYQVTSASSLFHGFDLDFGVTHTDLETSEFGVEAVAEVSDGEPGQEIILKNRDSRSGEVALFGTWNLGRGFVHGGPQIGVGLDPDQPAFFLGGALAFGRFVKLSAGLTSQEIQELSGGHELGTRVTSADEIRTRDTFDEGWYAALTISLGDTLSFFTPAEE